MADGAPAAKRAKAAAAAASGSSPREMLHPARIDKLTVLQ